MDQIQTGDTVEVIGVCLCGRHSHLLGTYSVVEGMTGRCIVHVYCSNTIMLTRMALIKLDGVKDYYPVRWLRKVPPLAELEKMETQESKHIEPDAPIPVYQKQWSYK